MNIDAYIDEIIASYLDGDNLTPQRKSLLRACFQNVAVKAQGLLLEEQIHANVEQIDIYDISDARREEVARG